MTNFYRLLKEASEKKKMDPVGKETADIDNDGDTDSSDKYLHNRRKAISKNIKKEEVEQVDEISINKLRRYMSKADQSRKDALDTANPSGIPMDASEYAKRSKEAQKISDKRMAGMQRAYRAIDKKTGGQESKYKYGRRVEEVEQVDELSKSTLGSYIKKASSDMARQREKRVDKSSTRTAQDKAHNKEFNRKFGIRAAVDKLTKEEIEQVDELSKKTLAGYIGSASADKSSAAHDMGRINQKAATSGTTAADRAERDELNRIHSKRSAGIQKAANKLAKEEVEQVDELSKKTMKSYQDKAREVKSDEKPRTSFNRLVGAARVARRLAKEEVEQVDEISKDTLNRATSKAYSLAVKGRMTGNPEEYENRMKQTSKFKKAADAKDRKMKREKRMNKEEVEGLDEISRDLASRYVNKAKQDDTGKRRNSIELALKKKFGNKKYGIPEPKVKATKEEVEQFDEVQRTADAKITKVKLPDGHIVYRKQRAIAGIQNENYTTKGKVEMNNKLLEMALDKLTEEELDAILEAAQLDELTGIKGKGKAQKYINAVRDSQSDSMRNYGYASRGGVEDPEDAKKSMRSSKIDYNKRAKGIKRALTMKTEEVEMALDKLTEEELDAILEAAQLDELSKKTLGSYIRKASDSKYDIGTELGKRRTMPSNSDNYQKQSELNRKSTKRSTGISTATRKLTKEEVELSVDPLVAAMVNFIKNEKK